MCLCVLKYFARYVFKLGKCKDHSKPECMKGFQSALSRSQHSWDSGIGVGYGGGRACKMQEPG